jgi:alkylation response protein AidB-like acyl-CoA dehydrogenase
VTLSATFDGHTDLAKRAAEMLPLLDRWAHYSDEAGELAPEVVEAFHREGMFQMWVPRALGGSELGPIDSLEVLEITTYGDPSAGWVQMASCLSTGTAAAYAETGAVDEIPRRRYPAIAGQGARPAPLDRGGYLLTGSGASAQG